MRRPALLLLLLLGCGRERLHRDPGGLALGPAALDFGRVYVGHPARRAATLRSEAFGQRRATLSAEGPFSVESAAEVGPGGTRQVWVTALADAPGPLAGVLRATTDEGELALPLRAEAEAPPDCAALPCQRARFDPDSGACLREPAPEGEACTSPCVASGRCQAGACVGALASCDDGDACTADACDAARGCLQAPVSCPAPSDPCQVARCDPARGCISEPADDGTACGPGDCVTSRVCVAGACVSRPTPEGAPCGEVSVCRAPGRCEAGACVQGPAVPIQPVWTYSPPDGGGLQYLDMTDEDGNLYWVEWDEQNQTRLVSATRDGVLRFSGPMSRRGPYNPDVAVAGDGLVLFISAEPDGYAVWRTSDGTRAWTLELNELSSAAGLPIDATMGWAAPVLDSGQLTLTSGYYTSSGESGYVVAGVDWRSGRLLWTHSALGDVVIRPAGDWAGNVYLGIREGLDPVSWTQSLVSLDVRGGVRWSVPLPRNWYSTTLAVSDGLVALGGNSVIDAGLAAELRLIRALDGALLTAPALPSPAPDESQAEGNVVPAFRGGAGLAVALGPAGAALPGGTQRVVFDSTDGSPLARFTSASWLGSGSMLTGRDSLVSLESNILREAHLGDTPDSLCTLGGPAFQRTDTLLVDKGRAFVGTRGGYDSFAIAAYDVPGLDLAPQGWVAARGNLQRTGTPR